VEWWPGGCIMKYMLAAAAAATTVSLAAPGPADAAAGHTAATRIGKVRLDYRQGRAGYLMAPDGKWRFRYLETTVTVPSCGRKTAAAGISLLTENDSAGISVNCDGGYGSVQYGLSWWGFSKSLRLGPTIGDRVTISIYYDRRASAVRFCAIDRGVGARRAAAVQTGNWTFAGAAVRAGGPTSPATRETRLWTFADTRLTTTDGFRGGILGPWDTLRIIGSPAGWRDRTVILWPSWPGNRAGNFSIWWRTAR
jgi:hypothetical protein